MNASRRHQSWVDVAVFENAHDGKMLEAFFRDMGIEARTYDDKVLRYFLFLRPPHMTHRVQVRNNDFSGVAGLLEANAPAVLAKALHCPSCGSLRVNYPQ